jgi:hypothetical protein
MGRSDFANLLRGLASAICLIAALSMGTVGAARRTWALDIPLTVKENADVGVSGYPVSAVMPLPRGAFSDARSLGIRGTPSQVDVLERWPGDGSLRHVMVHFQAGLQTHGGAIRHFVDEGPVRPEQPVRLRESSDAFVVTTGPIRFRIRKNGFNLLDRVWYDRDGTGTFETGELIVLPRSHNGGVFIPRSGAGPMQYDSESRDLHWTVEERGPMRVVIRVDSPARFYSTTSHRHGFAVRIYAYGGRPFIKIDYQIQNSARNGARSWPLYLEALGLDLSLNLEGSSTVAFGLGNGEVLRKSRDGGALLAQEIHNRFRIFSEPDGTPLYDSGSMQNGTGPEGFIDVSDSKHGVMAVIRNFWQMWPNGLAVNARNKLSLQLFPPWSAQWHDGEISPSGLYWIEDMQHVTKEVLLFFHGAAIQDAKLLRLARTFQFPPTPAVPTDWYRATRATLDLGGVIPPAETIPTTPDRRRPTYRADGFDPEDWYDPSSPFYGAAWVNFYDPEPGYRGISCTTGGWPYSGAHLVATGNPADYFESEAHGQGELNLRPEWMSRYLHDRDWDRLRLTENPYCGGRWRIFEGSGVSRLAAPPLPGTGGEQPVYYARDDQHGWFYHVAESYFMTGNPWVRDWYRFISQFRRVRLDRLDPFPDTSSRATGHSLHQVIQAYRITGDRSLLNRFRDHLRTHLRPDQDPAYGDQRSTVEEGGGGFQTGYLMRAIATYLEEVNARGDRQAYAEGFSYLSGLMEWNCNFGNFPYYFNAREGGKGQSSGTGLTLVDPQAWYYWHTGKQKYLDQINQYLTTGINGGEKPYGQFKEWSGQFEGRWYLHVRHTPRPDKTPPPPVIDLKAFRTGPSSVRLTWTAPSDAARYHIVWAPKPIAAESSTDPSVRNWWAANAIGPTLKPVAGKQQSLTIDTGSAAVVHAALFAFDSNANMSAMSNVAKAITE